ncbi:hypothetical protein AVEN_97961-1 [Araneus ventricosus]|uniref:Uncharacterized protein n=1 Tax=Araneus ventricosus TaxID=182803 RepID=A0A4Y2MQB4_ARAVE|nr:hypothetical protein AVEN_97961-1 [Araneus ventricosus]
MSRDVMNHFQDENLKYEDRATQSAAGIKVLDKEDGTKRAPLKEKFSQASQKQSGSLPKKPSAPDLRPCAAFGGIRFTAKRNACRKFDIFQKMAKDHQTVNPPEPCSKELKTTDSAKAIASKEIECSNEGNKEDPPTVRSESSKASSLAVKETTLKKCTAFGGIRFAPKWQSTPLKPDLFNNIQKVSKHDKELHPPDSSAKGPEKIPNSTKSTTKEDERITPDETVQPPTKEPKHLKPSPITVTEIGDKMYPAFAGMRLTPKRKSTHPKPDMFEKIQEESKLDSQESHLSGISYLLTQSMIAFLVFETFH